MDLSLTKLYYTFPAARVVTDEKSVIYVIFHLETNMRLLSHPPTPLIISTVQC